MTTYCLIVKWVRSSQIGRDIANIGEVGNLQTHQTVADKLLSLLKIYTKERPAKWS